MFNKKYLPKKLHCIACYQQFETRHSCSQFTIIYDYSEVYFFMRNDPFDQYNFTANLENVQEKINNFIKNLIFI
jgi:hypothetical protein